MAPVKPDSVEARFIEVVKDENLVEIKSILCSGNVNLECTDDNGMTPLMHAAYKGNTDAVELLISHGADVNNDSHEHRYTALMFATLAGSPTCVQLLLDSGANVSAQNSVNRTAAQLGAFVGRHDCVSLISNYVDKKEIDYFTEIHGLEDKPRLQKHLVVPLHNFVLQSNLHPVKLILYLQEHTEILTNHQAVSKVLELKSERAFKAEVNEVAAIKLHYQNSVLKLAAKWSSADTAEGKSGLNGLIKFLLRGRDGDGAQVEMDNFIRETVKRFEFPISNLFKQLVRTLASVPVGGEPTALVALTQAINGMQSADLSLSCATCGTREAPKKCSSCKSVNYCDVDCQKLHWFTHKKVCKELQNQMEVRSLTNELQHSVTLEPDRNN